MPRPDPAKRTPLWLQRLRAKDLLQVARQFPDFPIVVETVARMPRRRPRPAAAPRAPRRDRGRVGPRRPAPGRDSLAVHLGTDLPVHGGLSVRVGRARRRSDRKPGGRGRRRRPARAAVARRDDRTTGSIRRRSAGSRIACAGWAGRRAPPTRWPSTCGWLGDLTAVGARRARWRRFLAELAAGRTSARRSSLPGTAEPARWISAEEESLYRRGVPDGESSPATTRRRATIVRRFLQTHALIGLADLTARYPIASVEAAELLERWAERGQGRPGRAIRRSRPTTRVGRAREPGRDAPGDAWRCAGARAWPSPPRSSPISCCAGSTSIRRRAAKGPACARAGPRAAPGLRRAGRARGRRDPAAAGQGLSAGAGSTTCSAAATGSGGPRAIGGDEPRVAFLRRDFRGGLARAAPARRAGGRRATVLDLLGRHGASFATDLARLAGHRAVAGAPRALASSLGRGLVTNDRFDPLRPGSAVDAARPGGGVVGSRRARRRSLRARPRRSLSARPEGRWSRLRRAAAARCRGAASGLGRGLARALRRADARGRRA